MAKAKKAKKIVKKSRVSTTSSSVRVIEKMQQAIASDQVKLAKRYEKTIRANEKIVARLSAQIEKARKARTTDKPGRGRKPAKNAGQVLQASYQAAKAELDQLTQGYKKLLAEKKVLVAFEKEWKKTGVKTTKAIKAPKGRKTAKRSSKSTKTTEQSHDGAMMGETAVEMA